MKISRRAVRKLMEREQRMTWKVIDDRSGFQFDARKATMDSHGNLVHMNDCDPFDWTREPVFIPIDDQRVSVVRAEPSTDYYIPDEVITPTVTWDTITDNWEDIITTWDQL